MLTSTFRSSALRWQFMRYVAIGATVFCVDVGSFQVFVRMHALLPVAATAAYVLAMATQFSLNKYFNFRVFSRSALSQMRTYLAICGLQLILTVGVVEIGVHGFGLSPLLSKITAIAVNLPLGFFAHRHLTFGRGIRAFLERLQLAFAHGFK
jgi:putative flippase GtrA